MSTVSSDSEIGADFFGLSHPVVIKLIQSQPGARKCTNYGSMGGADAEASTEVNVNLLNTNAGISNSVVAT